jgi:carbon monoxide dehydrogenase subunit G
MDLTNEFTVHLPVEDTWALLTDLERIAPCMPGAQLQEVEGDEFRGVVKVKVGPITAQYKGAATFTSRDPDAHVAVLRAEGRDTRGQGNAAATITATVTAAGEESHVTVVTDLTVTGKVAQFGRNVLADVSAKLLTQFVERLEADLLSAPSSVGGQPAPTDVADVNPPMTGAGSGPTEVAEPAPAGAALSEPQAGSNAAHTAGPSAERRLIDSPPAEPIDLLGTAGPSMLRPLAGLLALVLVLVWLRSRRRR